MMNGEASRTYVNKVRQATQQHAQGLLADNERLRSMIAALGCDRVRLEERVESLDAALKELNLLHKARQEAQQQVREVRDDKHRVWEQLGSLDGERARLQERAWALDDVLNELDVLRGTVSALVQEKLQLQMQCLSLQHELDGHQTERTRLQSQLDEVAKENRRFSEQHLHVEAENNNLASLYVASYRLHGTLDRKEVLGAIQDIVVNLIGSEELAVYELEPEGATLRLVASFGIDPVWHDHVTVGEGRIGRVAAVGQLDIGPALGSERPQERGLTACVPLKLDGRVTGALALFKLLPLKAGFETVDLALFELLGTHAATALYCTRLQERLEEGGSA